MAGDYWESGVRRFGHYEEEEEEWVPYARPAAAPDPRFGHEEELARQREAEEAEEREREKEREFQERVARNVEQERLSKLIASGQARHINLDVLLGQQGLK